MRWFGRTPRRTLIDERDSWKRWLEAEEQRDIPTAFDTASDLLYTAWGIICNAHGGDWSKATPEWQEAVVQYRASYFELMAEGRHEAMSDADLLIEAANLLREHGYAIVTQVQSEMWDKWLRESHSRESELHDQITRLCGAYASLLDRITREFAPSRPRWLREARSWWARFGYQDPLVLPRGRP